ncbi:hypothetical protein SLA2020_062280 [Shorea laevis]
MKRAKGLFESHSGLKRTSVDDQSSLIQVKMHCLGCGDESYGLGGCGENGRGDGRRGGEKHGENGRLAS